MEINELFAISRFGMDLEKSRAKAASLNIANANTLQINGQNAYQGISVVAETPFLQAMQASQTTELPNINVIERNDTPRLVHQPSHPAADEAGYLRYPNINLAEEMTNLSSATRAYEANVKVMNAIQSMAVKALEIGGRR
ncbi:MAG: flagellar basal body rod protein FlgC [Pseudomonadota bacterium]